MTPGHLAWTDERSLAILAALDRLHPDLRADVCWFSGNGTDGRIAREAAISEIARRNREWVNIFEAAGAASGAIAAPRR